MTNKLESDRVVEELKAMRGDLDRHMEKFEEHERVEKEWHRTARVLQDENTYKIDRLCENTDELVQAWVVLGGAVAFGTAVGKFAKWLGSLAVIGVLFKWGVDHLR